jgi:hypothetical protein
MKINKLKFSGCLMALAMLLGSTFAGYAQDAAKPAPKKLLLVTLTKGWGHSSIPTGIKVTQQLAEKSGAFTLDYVATDGQMAEKMTAAALKNYDGVFFLSTTGELPIPDKAAFLDWIKSGHAFIGAHSATDTFHGPGPGVDPYIEMIGGEFLTHTETRVTCMIDDPSHPATQGLGKAWPLTDEIYFFKNFSREKVHMLLSLDKAPGGGQPGYFPIAWCKKYGQGNVFYTALGHEEAIWENPEFQKHLLGGIKWSLGLEKGDATPQASASAEKKP